MWNVHVDIAPQKGSGNAQDKDLCLHKGPHPYLANTLRQWVVPKVHCFYLLHTASW